ncbi:MAG: hypothetical protein GX208_00575 [Firmicutes bacterium]|nr:hypothetical protein [Bacillota bacterium]
MSGSQKTIILILTAVFFFTLGFFIFLHSSQRIWTEEPLPIVEQPVLEQTEQTAETENNEQIEQTEQMTQTNLSQTELPKPLISASEKGEPSLEQIVRESMQRELSHTWDNHQRYMGIFGDYVAVFRGEPGVGGILIEETDIPIAKLPEFEVNNLRQGIVFTTEEEKYSILEGLHFPR